MCLHVVGIIIPLLVVVLLPLTYLWLSTFGYVQPKPEYNDDELKRAVDIMFTQVLRSRDGKTRGMKKLKIINGLTRGEKNSLVNVLHRQYS